MNRYTVAVFLLLFISLPGIGQESDTVYTNQQKDGLLVSQNPDSIFRSGSEEFLLTDTLEVEARKVKSPKRALMYALVLPGLGQAYNEKYWKVPIVLAAMGGVGFAIVYNTREYETATLNYIMEESELNERKLEYRKRNMELSYIAAIVVYGLQILDAYVDAHLNSWDVNENLALGISPSIQPLMTPTRPGGFYGGLTCSIKFKGR